MAFGVLAGQITVIFLEVLLGYVGARSGIIKDRDSKVFVGFYHEASAALYHAGWCSRGR